MGKLIIAFILGAFVGVAVFICISCIIVGKIGDEKYNESITKSITKTTE